MVASKASGAGSELRPAHGWEMQAEGRQVRSLGPGRGAQPPWGTWPGAGRGHGQSPAWVESRGKVLGLSPRWAAQAARDAPPPPSPTGRLPLLAQPAPPQTL